MFISATVFTKNNLSLSLFYFCCMKLQKDSFLNFMHTYWERYLTEVIHCTSKPMYPVVLEQVDLCTYYSFNSNVLFFWHFPWVDNIRTDLREIGWKVMDWIHLAQDRGQLRALVNTLMNFRVSYNSGNFLTNWMTVSFSRRAKLHGVSSIL
jgi:hypothetical protein